MAIGQPVDVVTVADELRRNGLLDEIGGAAAAARAAERHAGHLERVALRQDRAGHGGAAAPDQRRQRDRRDRLPRARRRHQGARRGRDQGLRGGRGPRHRLDPSRSATCCRSRWTSLQETFDRGDTITGTATGFNDLDEILSGLQPSTLNIVGARPAMGKCVAWDTPMVDPTGGACAPRRSGTSSVSTVSKWAARRWTTRDDSSRRRSPTSTKTVTSRCVE